MQSVDNATPHVSEEYDVKVRQTIPFYEQFHDETIDLVKTIKPDAEVWLDTGCGTGNLVSKAFSHFPKTVFLLADPAEKMLIQAKKRLEMFPSSQIKFLDPVETEHLELNGAMPPQVITAIQSHHYLSREGRKRATERCFEILAKGGLYITFENIRSDSEQGIAIGLVRWKRYQVAQGRTQEIVEAHGKRFDTAYFPISIDDHLRLLQRAGFLVAELLWCSHMQAGFYAIK